MKNEIIFIIAILIGIFILYSIQFFVMGDSSQTFRYKTAASSAAPFSLAEPPRDSLVGRISSIVGDVSFQSRTATEAAKITASQDIKQIESVKTDSGSANIQFEGLLTINVPSKSEVDVIQTLPANLVFAQAAGSATYNKIGQTPVSIKALHLLVNPDNGTSLVTVDTDNHRASVYAKTGSVGVAFEDADLESKILEVKEGQTLTFNDESRTVLGLK